MLPALHSDPGVTAFVHFSMGIALRGPPQNGELISARAGGERQSIRFSPCTTSEGAARSRRKSQTMFQRGPISSLIAAARGT